jgi:hypothetical protein
VRQDSDGKVRQIGALLDLFFGFFSEPGTWSAAEITAWFQGAGLKTIPSRAYPAGLIYSCLS